MALLARFTDMIWNQDTSWYWNDFWNYTSGSDGVTTFGVTGTAAVAATTQSGIIVLTTGGVLNQSAGVATTNSLYLPVAKKPIFGRIRQQYTEAATNLAGLFFGFASGASGGTLLADTTGTVRASGTVAGIFKLTGTTVWAAYTANGSTIQNTTSTKSTINTAYTNMDVIMTDFDGVTMEVQYRVDNEALRDSNNLVIRHSMTIASATIMQLCAFVKQPGGATSEVANVDFIYAHQLR